MVLTPHTVYKTFHPWPQTLQWLCFVTEDRPSFVWGGFPDYEITRHCPLNGLVQRFFNFLLFNPFGIVFVRAAGLKLNCWREGWSLLLSQQPPGYCNDMNIVKDCTVDRFWRPALKEAMTVVCTIAQVVAKISSKHHVWGFLSCFCMCATARHVKCLKLALFVFISHTSDPCFRYFWQRTHLRYAWKWHSHFRPQSKWANIVHVLFTPCSESVRGRKRRPKDDVIEGKQGMQLQEGTKDRRGLLLMTHQRIMIKMRK